MPLLCVFLKNFAFLNENLFVLSLFKLKKDYLWFLKKIMWFLSLKFAYLNPEFKKISLLFNKKILFHVY
jgi:hypothetical protein